MIEINCGSVSGEYRFVAHTPGVENSERALTGWCRNLITDNGLDLMGNSSGWVRFCSVGSGASTPAASDVALDSRIATSSPGSVYVSANATSYYSELLATYTFAQGATAGNLSEVGVGPNNDGTSLYSRALIVDSDGDPTTITVQPIEVLTVQYRLRLYRNVADREGTIVDGATTYATLSRPADINFGGGALRDWHAMGVWQGGADLRLGLAATQTLGAVTGYPSGNTEQGGFTASVAPYTTGSHYRDCTFSFPQDQGNISGGIGAVSYMGGNSLVLGTQISFTPKIAKDSTKTLALVIRASWGRHTP